MNNRKLLTEKQRAKQKKHRKIYETFCAVRSKNPEDTEYACLRETAKKCSCSISGVKYAIFRWKKEKNV